METEPKIKSKIDVLKEKFEEEKDSYSHGGSYGGSAFMSFVFDQIDNPEDIRSFIEDYKQSLKDQMADSQILDVLEKQIRDRSSLINRNSKTEEDISFIKKVGSWKNAIVDAGGDLFSMTF